MTMTILLQGIPYVLCRTYALRVLGILIDIRLVLWSRPFAVEGGNIGLVHQKRRCRVSFDQVSLGA